MTDTVVVTTNPDDDTPASVSDVDAEVAAQRAEDHEVNAAESAAAAEQSSDIAAASAHVVEEAQTNALVSEVNAEDAADRAELAEYATVATVNELRASIDRLIAAQSTVNTAPPEPVVMEPDEPPEESHPWFKRRTRR